MVTSGMALAAHFGDGVLRPPTWPRGILGAVVKDPSPTAWSGGVPGDRGPRARRLGDFYRAAGTISRMTVHLFGVRHHGPGSARALVAALDELQPDMVLIEGPPEADELVALAGAERDGAAGGAARLRGRTTRRRRRVLAVRGVLPGVAGDPVRAGGRTCRCASATCRPRTSSRSPGSRRARRRGCRVGSDRPTLADGAAGTTTRSAGGRTSSSTARGCRAVRPRSPRRCASCGTASRRERSRGRCARPTCARCCARRCAKARADRGGLRRVARAGAGPHRCRRQRRRARCSRDCRSAKVA